MNYKPCGDKILVKAPDVRDLEKTKSGILVPGPGFVEHIWAEVVAISDGFYSESGALCHVVTKVGDTVAFHKGAGLPVTLDDEKYLLIRDIDVHMRKMRKNENELRNQTAFVVDEDPIQGLPNAEPADIVRDLEIHPRGITIGSKEHKKGIAEKGEDNGGSSESGRENV